MDGVFGGVVGAVEAGAVLVIEAVDVTTVFAVVTAVVVTTVPFPDPVACLFANSIKLSATSAFCWCITSTAVLSFSNTPCWYLSFMFSCRTSWRADASTVSRSSWNRSCS